MDGAGQAGVKRVDGADRLGSHRGAAAKSKVVVAVETPGDKLRFAAMRQVPRVSGDEIKAMAQACLAAAVVARTDGWQAYSLNSESSFHVPNVTGSGKNAGKLFPWPILF